MPATPFLIRSARPEDASVIADYNIRLAFETEQKQLVPAIVQSGVLALFEVPARGKYFVAEVDGQVVGQLMITFEWSDWRDGEIWWLQSVYVAAEYRSQGIFSALFEHVRQLAETTPKIVGLRLYVEDHNTGAQSTYKRLGLSESGYRVLERFFRAQ